MAVASSENSYVVLVIFTAAQDRVEAFSGIMSDSVADMRSVAGCRRYDFNRDPAASNRFMLYEVFDDEAAWEAHHARPSLQTLLDTIKPMLSEKPQRSVWSVTASHGMAS